jgi:hypothetical protein
MVGYRITVHHAAALVIGRQGMNFGERLVCKDNGTLVAAASTPKAAHGRVVTRHVFPRSERRVTADSRGVWSVGQDAGGNRFLEKRYYSKKAVISREETSQGRFCLKSGIHDRVCPQASS